MYFFFGYCGGMFFLVFWLSLSVVFVFISLMFDMSVIGFYDINLIYFGCGFNVVVCCIGVVSVVLVLYYFWSWCSLFFLLGSFNEFN